MCIYEIYTDGSAIGQTPNYYGGWGIVILKNGKKITDFSDSKFPSTNNEMELTAILNAIEHIENIYEFGTTYIIYTDSNYSLQCITNWCKKWINNGWINSKKEPVANKEIIEKIYLKLLAMPYVEIRKVKGHSNNEWNNYADELATKASALKKKQILEGEEDDGK